MKHASLFSGIGGFDLAAQWMGWENVFQVEIDDFCQKVLAKNFPNVTRYGDIKQFDGTKYTGAIDILTGGFPCQPYSTAGQRKGKEDSRHLWPEMLRIIGEIQPSFIVGENVNGLVNWSRGLVFEEVQADLENKGYQVQSYLLPACAKDAPHRRDRVWVIAYTDSIRSSGVEESSNGHEYKAGGTAFCKPHPYRIKWFDSNANGQRLQRGQNGFKPTERQESTYEQPERYNQFSRQNWTYFPSQPSVCRGDDGISDRLDRIKSLGNAIVPQVAFEIFKAIDYLRYK